jgi:hypothetical protein
MNLKNNILNQLKNDKALGKINHNFFIKKVYKMSEKLYKVIATNKNRIENRGFYFA